MDIYFGSKDETQVVTNSKGEFDDAKIHAPRSARPGDHLVKAVERNNQQSAQRPFLVRTNWSQFLFSPSHDDTNPYENVLDVNNVAYLSQKWRTFLDLGSSPAIVDGVIYARAHNNVFALKASTGAKLWSYKTGVDVGSSPAVLDGTVYVGVGTNLYALKAKTGTKLWVYQTTGTVSSPTVVNGVVYFGSGDHNVHALNAHTGVELWRYGAGGPFYEPTVVDGVVYVPSGLYENKVYALDARTGTKLWSHAVVDATSPSVANGVVYVGSYDYNVYALKASDGTELWRYQTSYHVNWTPAVAKGMIYVSSQNGYLYALNAKTGAEVWGRNAYVTGSQPVVANGVVYIGEQKFSGYGGAVYGLNADTGARPVDLAPGCLLECRSSRWGGICPWSCQISRFWPDPS